jgi:hypothetical protein
LIEDSKVTTLYIPIGVGRTKGKVPSYH